MAVVSGRLQISSYTDRDGNKRNKAEVVADNVYFGDSRRDSDSGESRGSSYSAPYSEKPKSSAPAPGAFSELDDVDGELPF